MTQTQYINVSRTANYFLIRELVNGKEVLKRQEINPVLFVPTTKTTNFRDFYNKKYLEEKIFPNTGDMKKYIEDSKEFGDELWGSNDLISQYLYYANYNTTEQNNIIVSYIDIEVCTRELVNGKWIDGGFPEAKDAKFPINAICDYRSDTKKYNVFTTASNWSKNNSKLTYKDDVIYHYCKNEDDLLRKWIAFYRSNIPHIITGWNCIHENSNVWLKDKIVEIKDVYNDNLLVDSKITNKFPKTKKNGYKITLINGQTIIASKDHIFPVYVKRNDEYTNFNKKQTIDMTVEDILNDNNDNQYFMVIPKHNNTNSNLTIRQLFLENIDKLKEICSFDLYDIRNKDVCTFKMGKRISFEINLNEEISLDTLHLLGLFFTDGSRSRDGSYISFTNIQEEIMEYVSTLNVYKRTTSSKKYIRVSNKNGSWYTYKISAFNYFGIVLYLMCYDKNGDKSLDVKNISMLSKKQFDSFLSGIIDGDGSIGVNITIANFDGNNKKIQELLLWNGYMSSTFENNVRIYKHMNKIAKNNLTLIHNNKKVKLQEMEELDKKLTSAKDINYRILDDFYVIKIKCIENTNNIYNMYDIETDTHYFYANGIKTHNCLRFDIPYIINRLKNLYGDDYPNKLSPWKSIKTKIEKTTFGNSNEYYQITGVSILDYLDLYKKYRNKPREKYNLDYISRCENPDDVKLHFEGTHGSLYYDDPVFFVDYNVQDVRCVVMFEHNLKFISLVIYLAYFAGINFEDNYSPVKVWETLIYRYAMDNNKVVPFKSRDREIVKESYEGAYVHPPKPGLKHCISSFDFTSLYPSIMRLWYTGDDVHQKGEDRQKLYNGLLEIMKNDPESTEMYKEIVQTGIFNEFYINNNIPKKVTEYLKENGVSLTTNCEFFDVTRKSIMIDLITKLFKERKADKKTAFNYKHKAQDIAEELERRGIKV